MTAEIRLEQASLEHMMKQPIGLRYASFCDPVLRGVTGVICNSQTRLGHLGDYEDYPSARVDALAHPHAVLIRFYPDDETRKPSWAFLADFSKQSRP